MGPGPITVDDLSGPEQIGLSPGLPRLARRLVDRARLRRQLDARPPLTILRAPVGYGKTTLLADWAARHRSARTDMICWVNAPGGRNRLWHHVVHAFRRAGLLGTARTSTATPDVVEHVLAQRHHDVLLVIDDFDTADVTGDAALLDLVRRCRRLRVAVCLSDAGRLPASGRADIDSVELTASELAFTRDETRALSGLLVPDLADEVATGVHHDLDGWPAPTRAALMALAMLPSQGRTLGAAQQATADVLADHLPSPEFPGEPTAGTLALAVPDLVTPEVVAALGVPGAADTYRAALSSGLLHVDRTGVPGAARWAPAIRRLLLARLASQHPDQLIRHHRTLCRYFRDQGRPDDALRHAAATADWDLGLGVIDEFWGHLFNGDRAQLRSVLSAVPPALLNGHPRSTVAKALVLGVPDHEVLRLVRAQLRVAADSDDALETDTAMLVTARVRALWPVAETFADRLERGTVALQDSSDAQAALSFPVRMLQVGITRMLTGDLTGATTPLEVAHREADTGNRRYVAADAASKLACVQAVRGELHSARHWLQRFRRRDEPFGWITPLIRTTALTAEVLGATASLSFADADRSANELLTTTENQEFWGYRLFALVRFALSCGSAEWGWHMLVNVRSKLRSERPTGQLMPVPRGLAEVLMVAGEANLLLSLQRGTQARTILANAPEHPLLHAVRARTSLLSNDAHGAADACNRGLSDSATPIGELIELVLIRALARHRLGQAEPAVADLRQASRMIGMNGNLNALRTIPRSELLPLAAMVPAVRELLRDPQLASTSDIYPESVDVIELTRREAQLLQLLDEGGSLQEMAGRLYVSVNTLKSQRRTLYAKLRAPSRQEALIRAREWGLLATSVDETGGHRT